MNLKNNKLTQKFWIIIFCAFLIYLPFALDIWLTGLSNLFIDNGSYKKALVIDNVMYKAKLFLLTEKNEFTIESLEKMARTNMYYGDLNKTISLYKKAYVLRNKYNKINSKSYFRTLVDLAYLNVLVNQNDNALQYLNEAAKLNQKLFSNINYLYFYIHANNETKAKEYYEKIIMYKDIEDSNYYRIIAAALKYFVFINDFDNSELMAIELHKLLPHKNNKIDDYTKNDIYISLAQYYAKTNQHSKSDEYIQKSLILVEQRIKPTSHIAADFYFTLGYLSNLNKNTKIANNIYRKNLIVQKNLLSQSSPIVVCSNYYLNNKAVNINNLYNFIDSSTGKIINIEYFCANYGNGGI